MRARLPFATISALAAVPPTDAAATVMTTADANAALAFWMTWGLVYLAIGVALLAVAVATAFREERAWSSLLRWTGGELAPDEDETPGDTTTRRRAA
jgi:hypothetical protein